MCNSFLLLSVFVLFLVFKREFLHVALVVVELNLQTRLASNSEVFLPLPSKGWEQRCAPPHPA